MNDPLTYYDGVLTTSEISTRTIKDTEIVNFLIERIKKREYILIWLDMESILTHNEIGERYIHEVLVFGYNYEKATLNIVCRENRKFVSKEVNFEAFSHAYGIMCKELYSLNQLPVAYRKEVYYSEKLHP